MRANLEEVNVSLLFLHLKFFLSVSFCLDDVVVRVIIGETGYVPDQNAGVGDFDQC